MSSKSADRAVIKLKRPVDEKYVCWFEQQSNLLVVLSDSGMCHKYSLKGKKSILVAGGVLEEETTMELRLSYQINFE